MTRPATKSVIPVAAVWKATPRQNTAHEKMTPSLRPIPSATGAARSAPKNVPAERIDLLNGGRAIYRKLRLKGKRSCEIIYGAEWAGSHSHGGVIRVDV